MAWLTAAPKRKDGSGKEAKLPCRADQMKADGVELPLPPLSLPQLYERFMEAGPVEASGMGSAPLSWREIEAWSRSTFARPSAWEMRLLRRLSREYLAELNAAEDWARPAPWQREPTQADRDASDRALRAAFGIG